MRLIRTMPLFVNHTGTGRVVRAIPNLKYLYSNYMSVQVQYRSKDDCCMDPYTGGAQFHAPLFSLLLAPPSDRGVVLGGRR